MNHIYLTKFFLLILLVNVTNHVQAALIDRGNGLIYDDVLDITWLQDANYAFSSGYSAANKKEVFPETPFEPIPFDNVYANGTMGWDAAKPWAENLSYGGFHDWRLPTLKPITGTDFNYQQTYDGSSDFTYNLYSEQSELA